jgi:hypothetical protein
LLKRLLVLHHIFLVPLSTVAFLMSTVCIKINCKPHAKKYYPVITGFYGLQPGLLSLGHVLLLGKDWPHTAGTQPLCRHFPVAFLSEANMDGGLGRGEQSENKQDDGDAVSTDAEGQVRREPGSKPLQ